MLSPNQPPPPSPAAQQSQNAVWPLEADDLVYCSTAWDFGDEDEGRFLADSRAARSAAGSTDFVVQIADKAVRRIRGFAHQCVAVSDDGSRWATSSFLSHEAIGLDSAFDLSAINGMNRMWQKKGAFVEPLQFLLTGDSIGRHDPVSEIRGTVVDVAFRPRNPNNDLLVLEWIGGDDKVSILVGCSSDGTNRRVIATLSNCQSYAAIVPHPAGQWVLITDAPFPRLVDISTGRVVPLPSLAGASCWLPQRGAGVLFGCMKADEQAMLYSFDLCDATETLLGPVEGEFEGFDNLYQWMPHLFAVSRSGAIACLSGAGVPAGYAATEGSRSRVHYLDPEKRTLSPVVETFLSGSDRFERECKRPVFVGRPGADDFEPADSLMAGSTSGEPVGYIPGSERVAEQALSLAITALNHCQPAELDRIIDTAIAEVLFPALVALRDIDHQRFDGFAPQLEQKADAFAAQWIMATSPEQMAAGTGPMAVLDRLGKQIRNLARS